MSNALVAAMSKPVAQPRDGLLFTPVFRIAFPHLDEPWAGQNPGPGAKPAFSLLGVFDDNADLREIMTLMNKRLGDKFGNPAVEQTMQALKMGLTSNYRYAIRPKADMASRFAGFEGAGFFASLRAPADAPPACLAYFDGKSTTLQPGAIERHLYAGAYAYATVSPFAYDNVGKGVSLGVRTIVKVADGEKFGGPKATTQEEAMATVAGVVLPTGLLPAPGSPTLEGMAEPPFDLGPAAESGRRFRRQPGEVDPGVMENLKGKPGADELMEIFNS